MRKHTNDGSALGEIIQKSHILRSQNMVKWCGAVIDYPFADRFLIVAVRFTQFKSQNHTRHTSVQTTQFAEFVCAVDGRSL